MGWPFSASVFSTSVYAFDRPCVLLTDLPSDGACAAIYDNPGQKDRSVVQEFSASHSEHFAEEHGP